MGTLYREATSIVVFTTLFSESQFLKKNIIIHLGFFPFKSRPLTKRSRHGGRHIGSQKPVSLCKNGVVFFLQQQRQITLLHQFLLPFVASGETPTRRTVTLEERCSFPLHETNYAFFFQVGYSPYAH